MAADAPHVLLTQAADKIETMAAAASPPPWTPGGIGDFGWCVHGPSGSAEFEDSETGAADAAWVSMLNPAVAPHISAWLRAIADELKWHDWVNVRTGPQLMDAALAVARCVLGLETP